MCPRVNGKAVRGRSHPFSDFWNFSIAAVTSQAGRAWLRLLGGFQANSAHLGGLKDPPWKLGVPREKFREAYSGRRWGCLS